MGSALSAEATPGSAASSPTGGGRRSPTSAVRTALELLQRGYGIAVDDAAVMHDLHAVAHGLHLGQDVSGEDYAVRAGELADQLADLADLVRIEADGRLVEDDDIGPVQIACAMPTRCW